jgi:hypothetical protein
MDKVLKCQYPGCTCDAVEVWPRVKGHDNRPYCQVHIDSLNVELRKLLRMQE